MSEWLSDRSRIDGFWLILLVPQDGDVKVGERSRRRIDIVGEDGPDVGHAACRAAGETCRDAAPLVCRRCRTCLC
jgi:hypothetical protein